MPFEGWKIEGRDLQYYRNVVRGFHEDVEDSPADKVYPESEFPRTLL